MVVGGRRRLQGLSLCRAACLAPPGRGNGEGDRSDPLGMSSRFEEEIGLMRRRDPRQQEDGFALLREHAAEHVDELMAEFEAALRGRTCRVPRL
jgi:hypothetical protein